ncbi:DUF499 domain-containing protein [Cerasicoccus arenae]|uniref:Swt1-like HEPN domain-containing protein n=1 Tax=Cerasicoccus arenae TaxID=424488 RepID=A0A8J3DF03_9BACT|nr:DUF499 domain-containing protein [Cerasicoccus arenae]MBK1857771.1 DUF499 domain-containing protein [Cerasicoccus arenae]GHC11961.1 hypothetical protein GCM10007047_31670 [Cerasicoccus arenae]
MALSNRDRLGKAIDLFTDSWRTWVVQQLDEKYDGSGAEKAQEYLTQGSKSGQHVPKSPKEWDAAAIVSIVLSLWQYCFRYKLEKGERSMLHELQSIRNEWAHQKPFSTTDTLRHLDTVIRLLNAINDAESVREVEKMHGEVMRNRFSEMQRTASDRAKRQATAGTPREGLRPWREIIHPHPDVRTGNFAQAEFAADLAMVHRGDAPDEYGKPQDFFRRTYLTEGLRGLLLNGIKRLSGKGGHPVIELQTNFGGGKTHSMLALYHLVSGVSGSDLPGVDVLMREVNVEELPKAARSVLVGTALNPGKTEQTPEGIELRTLWGRMAYQLGGKEAYSFVAENDAHGSSPGSDDLVKLFKHVGPCLILIDEWVAYLRDMYNMDRLPGGTFDGNLKFTQALTEAVKACPEALLVASLPQSKVEVGGQGGQEALASLEDTFGRLEFNWRPATADESYEIVRRRLFEPIEDPQDFADRDAVVGAYAAMYRNNPSEFPSECKEGNYAARIQAAYPIHPELFDRLYEDWSSLEEFQRTRGVLRLMACVIHTLWNRDDRSLIIMPGLLPIDEPTVESEMTRYLSPNWPVIIEKDVDGPNALPTRMDKESKRYGQIWATRRVARTVYLGSAPVAGSSNRGLEIRKIRLGSIQPGENIAVFGDALRELGDSASYLYADGARYWYSSQPNVTTTAKDRSAAFQENQDDLLAEICERLRDRAADRGGFRKIHVPIEDSSDIPDETDTVLVILHPSKSHTAGKSDSVANTMALECFEKRGNSPRINRNAIVFLAADRTKGKDLLESVASYLAWKSIFDERENLGLDPHNRNLAEKKMADFDRTVNARINETYQWLLVPYQTDPTKTQWQELRLGGAEAIVEKVFKRLKRDGLIADQLAGSVLKHHMDKMLWKDADHIEVQKLTNYFSEYVYLPRVVSQKTVLTAISDGIASLTWRSDTFAYAEGYDEEKKRYVGLHAAKSGLDIPGNGPGLVVKPEAAIKQLTEETQPTESGTPAQTGEPTTTNTGNTTTAAGTLGSATFKRFHASVKLNPTSAALEFSNIAEEVLQHFTSKLGAEVFITVEIEAHSETGFDDATRRTVAENSNTLGFDHGEFEQE